MAQDRDHEGRAGLSSHVLDGLESITTIHQQAQQRRSAHERTVEAFSSVLARPAAIYVVAGATVAWVAFNLGALSLGARVLDAPPFFYLQTLVCFAALITSLVVASAQRRQGMIADKRAHLDLQVNLLAEKKLAKLIALVEELRRDTPDVHDREDPEAAAMAVPADPQAVVDAIDEELAKPT